MGGGGSSKSSKTSTNVSGQNAIQGDNLGASVAGVNNSTVNISTTDHGAIEKAAALGELAMTSVTDTSSKAMDSVSEFAGNALDTYSATNSENLQMMAGLAGNQATQNEKNITALTNLAKLNSNGGQVAANEDLTKSMLIAGGVGLAMVYIATR